MSSLLLKKRDKSKVLLWNYMVNRNYAHYVMHILHKKKQLRAGELTTAFYTMETSAKLMLIFEFQKFYVSFIIYFIVLSAILTQ